MMRILLIFVSLWHFGSGDVHCLVIRPGYGLVSEKCPHGSTGCRIRINKDEIDFYEYSALYDRNQYVCVHKNEFDGTNRSGCIKKKSGKVRCWCRGKSNCNSPENSKALFEAFLNDDLDRFNDPGTAVSSATSPTTTSMVAIVKVPIVSKPRFRGATFADNGKVQTSGILLTDGKAKEFVREAGSKKINTTKTVGETRVSGFGGNTFSKSSGSGKPEDEKHKIRHHHHRSEKEEKIEKPQKPKQEKSSQSVRILADDSPLVKPTIRSGITTESKPRIHLDGNNEVHVVNVGVQDKYDRVANEKPIVPSETVSDDLYGEEELAQLDAEFAEQQKRENRPRPQENPEVIRMLPQEDDALGSDPDSDSEPILDEYFDSVSAASSPVFCFSFLLFFVFQ